MCVYIIWITENFSPFDMHLDVLKGQYNAMNQVDGDSHLKLKKITKRIRNSQTDFWKCGGANWEMYKKELNSLMVVKASNEETSIIVSSVLSSFTVRMSYLIFHPG